MEERECNRCHHKWFKRKKSEPILCPACKSPYWNKERVREVPKQQNK